MRILHDNCVDVRLKGYFRGFEEEQAGEVGFSALKNGDLLKSADQNFDYLITIDKNMRFQSSLKGFVCALSF